MAGELTTRGLARGLGIVLVQGGGIVPPSGFAFFFAKQNDGTTAPLLVTQNNGSSAPLIARAS
jgi:hypothetical protein